MVTIAVSIPRQTPVATCPVCRGSNEPWHRDCECCGGTGIAPLPRAAAARGDDEGDDEG